MTDESIFAAALAIGSPAERAAYLDRACAGQPDLRREVEELLAAHAADNPLDRPPADLGHAGAYEPPREQPGVSVGPYKLLQEIGEGGMGTVFMAEQQEPVRRKVALKIIKPGMDSKQVIARFEAERQALSMMDHPNIAKVLDAGESPPAYAGGSPRPFFVMELVHGVPITEFCDANMLSPRQRVELFVPVCQALQHAHQQGIIHRDIKPGNILVTMYDDKPVPKVIDFGVAKAVEQRLTERTLFTQFGVLIGTFEYMSPEQAEMNAYGVDTRSDVYSLGVLLYELLTGTTPLERSRLREAALGEVVRLIKEEEPPRPSVRLSTSGALAKVAAARRTEPAKLSALVRGELDWIVMKCLEKDRMRRYDTASALARDVERYLHDEPVEACPPTVGYRLRKSLRKHRGPMTVAAVVLLALVAGVVGTTFEWLEAQKQRDAARDAQTLADERRREVERTAASLQIDLDLAEHRQDRFAPDGRFVGTGNFIIDTRTDKQFPVTGDWHHLPGFGLIWVWEERVKFIPTADRLNFPPDLLELWAQVAVRGEIGAGGEFVKWDEPTWERKRQELAAKPAPYPDFPFPGHLAADRLHWLRQEYENASDADKPRLANELLARAEAAGDKPKAARWRAEVKQP